MKFVAATPHEGSPKEAARVLVEDDAGALVDTLSGETVTRAQVSLLVGLLGDYQEALSQWLDETCGAHPVLVKLKLEGFEQPECDGGWDFVEEPTRTLRKSGEEWFLNVEARYEHFDDRGGQFENSGSFTVRKGRFVDAYGDDLADASDADACEKALGEYFHTEGPG